MSGSLSTMPSDTAPGGPLADLGVPEKQIVVLMHDRRLALAPSTKIDFAWVSADRGCAGSGSLLFRHLADRLSAEGLLEPHGNGELRLSELGTAFANRIVADGEKAEFFTSGVGEWGGSQIDPLGLTNVLRRSS